MKVFIVTLLAALVFAGCADNSTPKEDRSLAIEADGWQVGQINYAGHEKTSNGWSSCPGVPFVNFKEDPTYTDTEGSSYKGTGSVSTKKVTPKFAVETETLFEQLNGLASNTTIKVFWHRHTVGSCHAPSNDEYGRDVVYKFERLG